VGGAALGQLSLQPGDGRARFVESGLEREARFTDTVALGGQSGEQVTQLTELTLGVSEGLVEALELLAEAIRRKPNQAHAHRETGDIRVSRVDGDVAVLAELDGGERIFERLAKHGSDMVRAWAAYALRADDSIDLKERIDRTHRFAADPSMAVRECAWESLRPHIEADLVRAIQLLERWVHEPDAAVRRCAIEGTRPCGVWTKHIPALKEKPEIGLPLLEQCRSDSSDYVRRAVANWLNDASKSQPKWVKEVCARWKRESPTKETEWIIKHALRTLRKKAKA